MPDIAHIGPSIGSPQTSSVARPSAESARPEGARPVTDRVEISDHARHLERLRSLPDVRAAKVDSIRTSIASGTYETPERMKVALQRLLEDLSRQR